MKVLCVNGSPRQNGNTAQMLRQACAPLAKAGADVREIFLDELNLTPCRACGICKSEKDEKCHVADDGLNEIIAACKTADVILIGSPVYFGSLTAQMKIFMDRVGYVTRANGHLLARKIGAAVVPARRAGHLMTFAELSMWFLINDMVVPGSSYWNVSLAREEGDVQNDAEALATLDKLGENLLWLTQKLAN